MQDFFNQNFPLFSLCKRLEKSAGKFDFFENTTRSNIPFPLESQTLNGIVYSKGFEAMFSEYYHKLKPYFPAFFSR